MKILGNMSEDPYFAVSIRSTQDINEIVRVYFARDLHLPHAPHYWCLKRFSASIPTCLVRSYVLTLVFITLLS